MSITLHSKKFSNKEAVFAASVFFAKRLGVGKKQIEIVAEPLTHLDAQGICCKKKGKFTIKICPSIIKNWSELLHTLAHEFVHVEQWANERIETAEICGVKFERFNGGRLVPLSRYPNTPCERDAEERGAELAKAFEASLG